MKSLSEVVNTTHHAGTIRRAEGNWNHVHHDPVSTYNKKLKEVKSGMGSPDWNVSVVDIHLQKLMWVYRPGHAGANRNDWADLYTGTSDGQSNPHKWLASQKIWSVEKLETLPVEHKAKDITSSTAWRREAWKEEALDYLPWKDERVPSSIRWTLELFQRQCYC